MAKFIINGGQPLHGSVAIGGAKNAGFKLMAASILMKGESRLLNIPEIGDVEITKEIIKSLGGAVKTPGDRTVFIKANLLKSWKIPLSFGYKSRAALMFAGPLLSYFGQADLPFPGGDKVGRRPIERHLEGLSSLGVKVKLAGDFLKLSCQQLKGNKYRFAKNTHTGTETMIMAAVKAKGITLLENAALEPEIDDLIKYLNQAGAKIKRLADRQIKIEGVKDLKAGIYKVMPDRNEAVSYACAALGTQGDIIIENIPHHLITSFLQKVKEAGGHFETANYGVRFWYKQPLKAVDVTTAPHPGFMTDWQPLWTVLMTQAKGRSQIIEAVHDSRLGFTQDLVKMGAKIKLFNPKVKNPDSFYNFNLADDLPGNFHAAQVFGLTKLKATNLVSADLRAGATLTLAGLIAKGKSVISGVEQIDRGYEDLDSRLRQLGADIKRIP